MSFGGLILTNRGRNLQSKAQAGVELRYTRIALGDGNLGSTPILDLNALISEKKTLDITKLKVLGEGRAVIGSVLSNQDMTEGFYFREIGVFAQDPDLGEILYCYGNAGELAEYIPAGGGPDIIEKNIDVQTVIGNAENISAIINESLVYATVQEVENAKQEAKDYTDQKIAEIPDPTWNNLKNKPSTFPPSAHKHPISDVTGLQSTLDELGNNIGNLSNLSTTVKTNLVVAVNELKNQLGNVTNLTTDEKSNLVSAINELRQVIMSHKAEKATLTNEGHVQLSDNADSDNETLATTPNAVRKKVEQSDYKVVKRNKDEEGIFTVVEYRRKSDDTLAIKSVLSGGISPQYTTRTITYYGVDGETIEKTSVFTLYYDDDGDLVGEE